MVQHPHVTLNPKLDILYDPPYTNPTLSRYDALLQEKEELEEAFQSFKQEVMLTREGNASKEIRILKKVIRNLEVLPL